MQWSLTKKLSFRPKPSNHYNQSREDFGKRILAIARSLGKLTKKHQHLTIRSVTRVAQSGGSGAKSAQEVVNCRQSADEYKKHGE